MQNFHHCVVEKDHTEWCIISKFYNGNWTTKQTWIICVVEILPENRQWKVQQNKLLSKFRRIFVNYGNSTTLLNFQWKFDSCPNSTGSSTIVKTPMDVRHCRNSILPYHFVYRRLEQMSFLPKGTAFSIVFGYASLCWDSLGIKCFPILSTIWKYHGKKSN